MITLLCTIYFLMLCFSTSFPERARSPRSITRQSHFSKVRISYWTWSKTLFCVFPFPLLTSTLRRETEREKNVIFEGILRHLIYWVRRQENDLHPSFVYFSSVCRISSFRGFPKDPPICIHVKVDQSFFSKSVANIGIVTLYASCNWWMVYVHSGIAS